MKREFARWALWAIAAAGTAWAVIDVPKEKSVPAVPQPASSANTPQLGDALRRAPLPREFRGDPFATFEPTPARRAMPSSPAEPAAQFPFRLVGYLQQKDTAPVLYLERGTELSAIRVGELIDGFRIDAWHDDGIEVTLVASARRLSVPFASFAGTESPRIAEPARGFAPATASGPVPIWPASAAVGSTGAH